MTKRMLIDASHAEETRVVMLDGSRLDDYDIETAAKKQLKGNIYLAKIVRVEPSLQAAFVEYGGNRHGFLAFGEIHPDYYQIPIADRQRLLAMQEEEAEAERAAEDEADEPTHAPEPADAPAETAVEASVQIQGEISVEPPGVEPPGVEPPGVEPLGDEPPGEVPAEPSVAVASASDDAPSLPEQDGPVESSMALEMAPEPSLVAEDMAVPDDAEGAPTDEAEPDTAIEPERAEEPPPETIGGTPEGGYEREERRTSQRLMRHYKIQEVIRRRQVILVQVVKEERGTKGAALTTYISLAGRFCVLMPNSPRGGGVSRKITSVADRRRLKEITAELDIPKGMAMIVRTAGAQRPRPEIKRDCEYLLRLWDDIRDTTLASMAPALIYEEASLIKRAIRDVYSSDVEEILVDGEEGWRAARGFMRTLMPMHARKVQLWREAQPLFARHNVEGFLDAMMNPAVQLRSGGYLVINQTEALVAIDVNSGRSTRERGIEETALRTNLEAADEVARQLRLRDLAGLIVIDFIDMESRKHNFMVERRMKEALRFDRARIQVGAISHFGLMEMSRQRLRPSLVENSFVPCEHCSGTGLVRGVESGSLHVLRAIEAAGGPRDAAEIAVHVSPEIALYILNNKREWLGEIERRCVVQVTFETDPTLRPPAHRIIKTQMRSPSEIPAAVPSRPRAVEADAEPDIAPDDGEPDVEMAAEPASVVRAVPIGEPPDAVAAAGETEEEVERKRKRRRRRRRGERKDEGDASAPEIGGAVEAADEAAPVEVPALDGEASEEAPAGRSRRGRRSGRRRRRDDEEVSPAVAAPDAPQPVYIGPTPADPFNGAFDIFDALAQSEDHYMTNMSASAASFEAPPSPEPDVEPPTSVPEPTAVTAVSVPEAEPEPEPAVKPILVGAGEPTARRSGWWRR